ncbi:unnamed protein product [Arabidopsis lyrata]|nr:unnamed protein product [Arabidopsis lyrata]
MKSISFILLLLVSLLVVVSRHRAVLIYKGRVNGDKFKLPWSGKVNIRDVKNRYARHLREGNPPEGGVGENSGGDTDDDDDDDDGHAIGGGDVFPPIPHRFFDPIVFRNHGFQFVPGGGFRIWNAST